MITKYQATLEKHDSLLGQYSLWLMQKYHVFNEEKHGMELTDGTIYCRKKGSEFIEGKGKHKGNN